MSTTYKCGGVQVSNRTHRASYGYCVGPFRTKRAALFVQRHPFCIYTIADAERMCMTNQNPGDQQ